MPAGHLAQSPGQVVLGLVQGKIFLGEQSFKPSDLTLVPLSRRLLPLRLLGEDPNPLLQGGDLVLGLPSLGGQCRAFLPKLGRNLALLRELPLGRLPGSPLALKGRPSILLPTEKYRLLLGGGLERLQDQRSHRELISQSKDKNTSQHG
jgi:hypothetical protein